MGLGGSGFWEGSNVNGLVYKRGAGCDTGAGREDDIIPVTSENIEGVRAIGSHVASLLAVIAIKFSTSAGLLGNLRGAAVILQQIAGEDIMTRPLADLAHLPFCC